MQLKVTHQCDQMVARLFIQQRKFAQWQIKVTKEVINFAKINRIFSKKFAKSVTDFAKSGHTVPHKVSRKLTMARSKK